MRNQQDDLHLVLRPDAKCGRSAIQKGRATLARRPITIRIISAKMTGQAATSSLRKITMHGDAARECKCKRCDKKRDAPVAYDDTDER